MPLRDHWLPLALLEVSVTLPPVQNVVGPPVPMTGVGGIGVMVTFDVLVAEQPDALVTTSVRPTVPDTPAV